jgi:hypothetical protein
VDEESRKKRGRVVLENERPERRAEKDDESG